MKKIQTMLDARKKFLLQLKKDKEKALKKVPEGSLRINPKKVAEQIYESLHQERQKLITPIVETNEQFIKKWENIVYEKKNFPPNYPEYYTNKGERVRSKSEIMIADALDKAGVPYRYEYPLYVKGIGNTHPDFLTLNIRTRKEIFWNHLGMLDDPKYAEDNVWKINQYLKAGYYPGENMILTYETKDNPLNQKIIKQMIEHYLK